MDFSDSDRGESEYESDGEEDERSPPRRRVEEPEQEYEEEEGEEEGYHEEEERNEMSEDEAEVCYSCKTNKYKFSCYLFQLIFPAVLVQLGIYLRKCFYIICLPSFAFLLFHLIFL